MFLKPGVEAFRYQHTLAQLCWLAQSSTGKEMNAGDESQTAVEMQELLSFRETGTKSMGKWGPCLPRKWSSHLGWVQNDCVSKQCVSMRESGGRKTRETHCRGFQGEEGSRGPQARRLHHGSIHRCCWMAVDGSSRISRDGCGAQWRSLPFSAVPLSPSYPGGTEEVPRLMALFNTE